MLVFKEHITAQSVSDSLLIGNGLELEAQAVGLERLGSPKLKWLYCAQSCPVRKQGARIGLSCSQTLFRCLVLGPHGELLRRYILLLDLISENMSLNFQLKWLFCVRDTYNV